jgi:hypothetical protein
MQDFLKFRKMVTPIIIQILFWIGVAVSIVFGLILIVKGATADMAGGMQVLTGILMLLLGPIAWRVYCELLIVIFRISETLVEVRDALRPKA